MPPHRRIGRIGLWRSSAFAPSTLSKRLCERTTSSDTIFSQVTYAPLLKRQCGGKNRPLVSFRGVKRRGNPLNRNENISGDCLSPHLLSQFLTAQAIHAISSSTDKNSSHSFAVSLAWYMRLRRKWKNAICVLCTRANNCAKAVLFTRHVRSSTLHCSNGIAAATIVP